MVSEEINKMSQKMKRASKKVNRNSTYKNNWFSTKMRGEYQSQEEPEMPVVFCSVCGAPQEPPFENHQPSIASIEEEFKDRDLIISTNLQDDKSLFVALLEETSADANNLEQEILAHKLVSSVKMVDGGLLVDSFVKSGTCDECDQRFITEKDSEEANEVPYSQLVKNKLELLKQLASDDTVSTFERFVNGDELDNNKAVDLKSLYPRVAEESDDGSFTSINTEIINQKMHNGSSIQFTPESMNVNTENKSGKSLEELKRDGFEVYKKSLEELKRDGFEVYKK